MTRAIINRINSLLDFEDLLFKDFFITDSFFDSIFRVPKVNYPVDIKEFTDRLEIEIAVVGLDKEDISIETKDKILRVSYNKDTSPHTEKQEGNYIHRGIAKRSFNLGWKIMNPRIDLSNMDAVMDKGLLRIRLPLKKEKPVDQGFRRVKIK